MQNSELVKHMAKAIYECPQVRTVSTQGDAYYAGDPITQAQAALASLPCITEAEIYEQVKNLLAHHVMSFSIIDGQDGALLLVDKLTPNADKTIERGKEEIEHLASDLTDLIAKLPHIVKEK